MFSGLIAHVGRVALVEQVVGGGLRLRIRAREALREGIAAKDSIAVNGVCLTVTAADDADMTFDVVPETVSRSTLASLRVGDPVNVELSLRLSDRLGGHLVYGHVDATVAIVKDRPEGQGRRLWFERPPELSRYIVEKGFVALDGVSLTVASTDGTSFSVALIPETARRTTFAERKPGDRVNLEIDPIARYALGAVEAYRHAAEGPSSAEIEWAYEI
jgi:riboflavin synthase alpha subunit